MTRLAIRPYRPGDEAAVIRLWKECKLVVPVNHPRLDIERKLGVQPEGLLVGLTGGELVATCMVGYDGHRGYVNYLAVSPRHRREGFGAAMMKEAERLVAAAGCPKVNLQVRTTNLEVLAFYRRIGYVQDDVVGLGKRLKTDPPFEESP